MKTRCYILRSVVALKGIRLTCNSNVSEIRLRRKDFGFAPWCLIFQIIERG
jgi:hypothetical protein